jgi:hypothetical protein
MAPKTLKNPQGAGAKKIEIDWSQFNKLCTIQCTLAEMASYFDCSEDTIENKVKEEHGVKFSEYYAQKRGKGKVSLRRTQFTKAMEGNIVMLIWLGKQYLGQVDKAESQVDGNQSLSINITQDEALL